MDDHVVWQNAGVSWTYEPGSTIKIFTFAAAFDAGLLEYNEPIDCGNGAARVGRFTIRDTHRMGTVPAWMVMQHSSNIGAMRIGRRLDQQTHYETLARFGFGQRTSLLREDVAGILRPPPWAESEHSTISYGHGLTVTPLQLNMATAAIANRGVLMEPMLVDRIENSEGALVQQMQPREVGRAVSEEAAELTRQAIVTVTEREGTGRRSVVPGILVAGKTGTSRLVGAQGYETEYMTSFTGFLPADAPEFAITVMIVRPDQELGYYGGVVAAPLFRQVAEQALLLDGYTLQAEEESASARSDDSPHGDGDADEEAIAADGSASAPIPLAMDGVTPDLRGLWLTEAMERIAAGGWQARVNGSGRVVRQNPPAWAGEPADGIVEVWLQSASRVPVENRDEAP
jgi:cell division protein FtsI (penicillin-binding protein 3)